MQPPKQINGCIAISFWFLIQSLRNVSNFVWYTSHRRMLYFLCWMHTKHYIWGISNWIASENIENIKIICSHQWNNEMCYIFWYHCTQLHHKGFSCIQGFCRSNRNFFHLIQLKSGGRGGGLLKHLSSIENVSPLSRTYRCKDTFYLYWMSSTSIESTILLRWQCKLSVEYTFSLPAGSLFFSFFCWTLFASGFLLLASHC